jgi:FKBP-type peptidyl-prolyl cis-trans isomerase FkpA
MVPTAPRLATATHDFDSGARTVIRHGNRDWVVPGCPADNRPALPVQIAIHPTRTLPMPFTTTPSGLQYEDTVVGTGPEARPGRNVVVHYTGWLYENGEQGAKFDSSKDRGEPFIFPLGGGMVIKGWDEGVQGMKEGGQRTLIIPPALGYGARGAGGVIPPNATLKFDVELLGG